MIRIFTNSIFPHSLVAALLVILCSGCATGDMERDYFDKEYDQLGARREGYSIPDKIKIYLYGMQSVTPPATGLSRQIAKHGEAAIPHLLGTLGSNPSDQNIKDLMVVFEAMQSMATYNVQGDRALIRRLDGYVNGMKSKILSGYTQGMLIRIKQSNRDSD